MKTNRKYIGLGVFAAIIALVGVLAIGAVAFAQNPDGDGCPGHGLMGRLGGPANSLVAVAAEALGMERADLIAELQAGKTIAQVAQEQGKDAQIIVDNFLGSRQDALAQMVADGRLTQEQADAMLAAMEANVTAHLSQPWMQGYEHGPRNGQGHRPGFVDTDGDGVCDNWVDKDGDGLNDLRGTRGVGCGQRGRMGHWGW